MRKIFEFLNDASGFETLGAIIFCVICFPIAIPMVVLIFLDKKYDIIESSLLAALIFSISFIPCYIVYFMICWRIFF